MKNSHSLEKNNGDRGGDSAKSKMEHVMVLFPSNFSFLLHELSMNDNTRSKSHHTPQNIAKSDHYILLPCYLDMPQRVLL